MADRILPERPDLYIVARILDRLWHENDPMLKTRLQLAARINYDAFSRYLEWMMEKGLVSRETFNDGHEGVRITAKGEEAYRRLVQWIDEVIYGKMP
jgi:predicted transcriptional regulator